MVLSSPSLAVFVWGEVGVEADGEFSSASIELWKGLKEWTDVKPLSGLSGGWCPKWKLYLQCIGFFFKGLFNIFAWVICKKQKTKKKTLIIIESNLTCIPSPGSLRKRIHNRKCHFTTQLIYITCSPLYRERCLVGVVAPSKMALSKKSIVDSVYTIWKTWLSKRHSSSAAA